MELRKCLWQDLTELAQKNNQSWLIVGDFNTSLSPQDRLAGDPVSLYDVKDFKECIRSIGVIKLPLKDHYYS